jgi:WD40-like Beta Propeller Repeat
MKRITAVIPLIMTFVVITATAQQFTDWSPPVNLGPVVNSNYADSCVAISKDGLSLFFSSNRQTKNPNSLDRDLYVSKRSSVDAAWGPPAPLTTINTSDWESCPALSLDEHKLYFTSTRAGGYGAEDLWVSRRHDRQNDFGWEPPVNLGGQINSGMRDLTPALFEDEAGNVVLYFSSNRIGSAFDIYQSVMKGDDTFGPATAVSQLNGPYFDMGAVIRRDGLEVIFQSNRPTGSPAYNANSMDFWVSTRASTADPWSPPVFVPSLGSPAWAMGRIALSFDGRELYFASTRGGNPDLWVAKREKLRGK